MGALSDMKEKKETKTPWSASSDAPNSRNPRSGPARGLATIPSA
jgi:hypothetical protein